jgi:hypothetical protein
MATATMLQTRPAQADAREEKRRQWLERVNKELETAATCEPHHRPDKLVKHLDHMVEISAQAEVLGQADKIGIRERVRTTKLALFERHIDHLLDQAISATRDKDRQLEKIEFLKQANDAFTAAIRLGASDAIKDSIKQRLDIIRDTSAAGDSTKAKDDAEREAKRRELTHPKEHRTFTRWRDPQLMVVIGGRRFTTVDWSLGGLLIDEFDDEDRRPGEQIEIKVGLSTDRLYKEKIEVVRYLAETRQLAVRSRRFASALMQIKRDCDAQNLDPA